MATTQVPAPAPAEAPSGHPRAGLLEYLTTVDHKKIGSSPASVGLEVASIPVSPA
jgi:hypothetical protein